METQSIVAVTTAARIDSTIRDDVVAAAVLALAELDGGDPDSAQRYLAAALMPAILRSGC